MKRSLLLLSLVLFLLLAGLTAAVPFWAQQIYGPPAARLSAVQRLKYSALLLWHDGLLTEPALPEGEAVVFTVETGETAPQIAARLQAAGLIRDAQAFCDYLVYSGLDVTLQSGEFALSPAVSALEIADRLQNAVSHQVDFVVLAGWRAEEVAALLPTSGLNITADEFLQAVRRTKSGYDFLLDAPGAEGFLLPDVYTLPRDLSAEQLVERLVQNFAVHLTRDLRDGFARQGLTVYQAVVLASIVQRESVLPEEMPLIASVFYNRLRAGMKLESDPTVQYALGYDAARGGWWPVPLTAADLAVDSPYNTYLYAGLPPTPIANPGLEALQAVAFPATTPYYYFRAACDGSGRHRFAATYDEHLQNACP